MAQKAPNSQNFQWVFFMKVILPMATDAIACEKAEAIQQVYINL
jgi:hypothetical protein